MTTRKITAPGLTRDLEISDLAFREEGEQQFVELTFSSETPVRQMFGNEVLDHKRGAVRLDRLQRVGPALLNHDPDRLVGKVISAHIRDRKGFAVVQMASTKLGADTLTEIREGVRTGVSVGYRVHRMVLESTSEERDEDTYRVTDWEPMEISFVAVPADPEVGIGGRMDEMAAEREILVDVPEETRDTNMDTKTKTDAAVPAKTEPDISAPRVDPVAIQRQAAEDERGRIQVIDKLAAEWKQGDLGSRAVEGGWSVEQFREELFKVIGKDAPLKRAADPTIGLSEKEAKRFSFVRAMRALLMPNDRAAQNAAGFEFECSAAVGSIMKSDPQGIYVPSDVMRTPLDAPEEAMQSVRHLLSNKWGQRDMTVGTATAGGHTVQTDLLSEDFIDLLRNRMMVRRMGAQFISGLNGNVAFPRQTGGATAYWVAENAAVTESAQAFDQLAMSPTTVGAFADYSRRLLIQSSIDIEAFVRADLSLTLALAIDLAAINGSGASNQPTGVLNTTSIGDVDLGANGAAPTWADIVELWSDVATANADLGATGFLTNSAMIGKLMTVDKASGAAQFVVTSFPDSQGMTGVAGARCGVSNQVPANLTDGSGTGLSAMIYGNWADLIVGLWGALDLTLDPYTGSTAGTKRIVALQDVDVGVRHAGSFSAIQDAVTS